MVDHGCLAAIGDRNLLCGGAARWPLPGARPRVRAGRGGLGRRPMPLSRRLGLAESIRRTGWRCQGQYFGGKILAARPGAGDRRGTRGPNAPGAARGRGGAPGYAATRSGVGSGASGTSTGGLWAGAGPFDKLRAGHRPRWVRIFSITSAWSMQAIITGIATQQHHGECRIACFDRCDRR